VRLKDHVNIGFLISNLSPEKIELIKCSGKTMKPIGIKS
jgi:hypothetical protein